VSLISKAKRDELVLLHSPCGDLFIAGSLTGLALALPIAVFLLLTFKGPDPYPYIGTATLGIFVLTLSAGIFLPLEHRMITTYRLTSSFPIFPTLSFVVLTVLSFVLHFGNPDYLGFRRLLESFFVLPILITLIIAAVYCYGVRKIFFALLYRRSRLDYVSLFYRDTVSDRLAPAWDTMQRYGGGLSLLLIRFSYDSGPDGGPRSFSEAEDIELLDRTIETVKGRIRGADETGIYSRFILWVTLPHTNEKEGKIPTARLLTELEGTPRLQAYRDKRGLRVSGCYLAQAEESMLEPRDLLEKAVKGLETSGEASLTD
jgi:hypothetical protein